MDKYIKNVWEQYQVKREDTALRNILVERYMSLVKMHAYLLWIKLPSYVSYDDLESEGYIGLMKAVKTYDMGKNNQFEAYAYVRIKGEMLDWLRANNRIPRWLREKDKKIKQAEQAFMAEVGRRPTDEELAKWVGMEAVELDKFKTVTKGMRQISIENPAAGSDESDNMEIKYCLRDKRAIQSVSKLQWQDISEALMRDFSCRDRLIINLRFYESLTIREIGMTVGLVETRISQLIPQLLNRIEDKIIATKGKYLLCRN